VIGRISVSMPLGVASPMVTGRDKSLPCRSNPFEGVIRKKALFVVRMLYAFCRSSLTL
jgi:hypothetical protein